MKTSILPVSCQAIGPVIQTLAQKSASLKRILYPLWFKAYSSKTTKNSGCGEEEVKKELGCPPKSRPPAPKEDTVTECSSSCENSNNTCTSRNITKPCREPRPAGAKAKKEKEPPFKSMWENPDCCNHPCPDFFPRYDVVYYKISDKAKRNYQRTWDECYQLKVEPKVLCCHPRVKYPEPEKRKYPITDLCRPADNSKFQAVCEAMKGKCPDIVAPCCKKGRKPPKCFITRGLTECSKFRCPYPSFSECCRSPTSKAHPVECHCMRPPMMCEVWEHYRKLGISTKRR